MSDSPEQTALELGRVFTPAVPISQAELFAGRRDQIRRLVDAINHRGQHAAIFGDRGVGKTSLANIISDKLTANGAILSPHVTCDTTDDFGSLWRKVLSEIDLTEKRRQPGFQQLTTWEETKKAGEVIGENVTPDDLRRLFTLIGNNKVIVIVLDEFDRLEKQRARCAVADTIKTFSDHSVPATIIVVGIGDTVDELIAEHESIERALVQIQMPRMAAHELIQILKKGTSRVKMTIDENAARFIASLSQGLPYYTHLLGLYAARTALDHGSKEVVHEHVTQAITTAVANSQQSLVSALRKATSSPQIGSTFGQVLLACALAPTDELGFFGAADVRKPLSQIRDKTCEIPSFAKHLKVFCEPARGKVLQKTGAKFKLKYRFTNALMPPLILMNGLVDKKISIELLEEMSKQ